VFALVSKYGGGVSGLARFAKSVRQRDAENAGGKVPEAECAFVDQVLDQAWRQTQSKYGPDPQRWQALAQEALCRQQLGYMESLDGFPSLDPRYDVNVPLLKTIDGSTVLSQRAQAYTQFVPLHDTDEALSILPIGNSDDPGSSYRFSTYGDWAQGRLHPAPLSRGAVARLAVSQERLGGGSQSVRRQAMERAAVGRQAKDRPQRPQAATQPLPGKKPDDPTLEMAIRYLNRPERSEQEVRAKLEELADYVSGNADLEAELAAGLELFVHLMRESQAGRLPIRYGTPETLKRVEDFYLQLEKK
jgi:hypothetical protein